MKRTLAFLLSLLLLVGVLTPCAFAADTATTPGAATLGFERTGAVNSITKGLDEIEMRYHAEEG